MYLRLRERSGQRSSVGPTCFASREVSARLAKEHRAETCLTRMSPGEPMWPRAAFEGSCLAHADAGGLISYGPDLPDMFRGCGVYVGRILGGIKSADLPIERPARFELARFSRSLDPKRKYQSLFMCVRNDIDHSVAGRAVSSLTTVARNRSSQR
jgi:hypothetical protein